VEKDSVQRRNAPIRRLGRTDTADKEGVSCWRTEQKRREKRSKRERGKHCVRACMHKAIKHVEDTSFLFVQASATVLLMSWSKPKLLNLSHFAHTKCD